MSKNIKIAFAVLGVGALVVLRREKTIADAATTQIEGVIDQLDPAARAAVIAKLGLEAKGKVTQEVHDRLS